LSRLACICAPQAHSNIFCACNGFFKHHADAAGHAAHELVHHTNLLAPKHLQRISKVTNVGGFYSVFLLLLHASALHLSQGHLQGRSTPRSAF
jgi:hypothetical protein